MVRLTEWARSGQRQDMYASAEQREADIDAGAGRTGLELQIDLDTSAGRLDQAFDAMDEAAWESVVELRGGTKVPARLLPLSRLLEVVIHHVDLDIGFEIDQIENATAEWLLEWCAFRVRSREEFPRLDLTSDSGFTVSLGSAGEPAAVQRHQRQPARVGDESGRRLGGARWRGTTATAVLSQQMGTGGYAMSGLNHVEPGGAPLLVRLSPTVTMTKLSVGGPMDNNAYLLQARGGVTILVDAANDSHRLLKLIGDEPVRHHRHHPSARRSLAGPRGGGRAHRRPADSRPAGR